jgi:hypothetical protein
MSRARWAVLALAPVWAGCLEVQQTTYRFDLAKRTGTLLLYHIQSDDLGDARQDFGQLVNDYVLGDKVAQEHPTWTVGPRRLFERDGFLCAEATFTFASPAEVGLYQHDKKSAYLWCAASGETIVATSGEVIPQYPNCVAFSRKDKVAEVTVTPAAPSRDSVSLVDAYRTWDGKPITELTNDPFAVFGRLVDAAASASGFDLGKVLPKVALTAEWAQLALPTDGGTVLVSSPTMLEVTHSGVNPVRLIQAYGAAIQRAGYRSLGESDGGQRYERDGDKLLLTVTVAGPSALVILAR